MNNQTSFTEKVLAGLTAALHVPVIKANQSGPSPAYPYISYTITTPMVASGGTWGVGADGIERREFGQTWSFTIQSDHDEQALNLALNIAEWFHRKNSALEADNIIVKDVSNITNRDTFLTIEYEHRYGLDVTFNILHEGDFAPYAEQTNDVQVTYEKEA